MRVLSHARMTQNTTTVVGARRNIIDVFPGVDNAFQLDGTAYDAAPARVANSAFYRMGLSHSSCGHFGVFAF